MVEAVIFDVDGTLVDSVDLHCLRNARGILQRRSDQAAPALLNARFGSEMVRELNVYASADGVLTVSQKEADWINDFLGDLQTNEREQQTRLALEIAMDEAFGAIGGSSNFTSCGGLVASRREKFARCRNQRGLTRSPIPCPAVGIPGSIHIWKSEIFF